jgi:hypothetical protein
MKLAPDAPAPLPCSINMRVIPRLQARKMLPLYGQRPSDLLSRKSFHVPHKSKTLSRLRKLPHHYDFSPRLHTACAENVTAPYDCDGFPPRRLFPQMQHWMVTNPHPGKNSGLHHKLWPLSPSGERTLQPLPYSGTSERDFAAPPSF